jgi:hypothetical protein
MSQNILHAAKPHQTKYEREENRLTPQDRAQHNTKEKARRCRAF